MISRATAFFLVGGSGWLIVLCCYFYVFLLSLLRAGRSAPFNHVFLVDLCVNVSDKTFKGRLNTDICFGAHL